jgi:pyruvate/2-oxoglutarate dehydrogenase complex dihydrolipoamide dehydrogenase (E3) component
MEAARVAALKGHKVKLYDKNSILGGQVVAAVTPSFKTQLKAYMAYLENQVRKLAVEIHLDTSITADSEELQGADQIIVAVGASPLIPKISGLESSKVIEASEAHIHRRAEVGQNVVVCGGGLTGCDLALELAMEGKNVTIVEMADRVAMTTNYDNILCLTAMLPEQGVVIMAKTKVVGFTEQGVEVENPDGNVTTLEADTVILAFGTRPNATLAESICSKYPTAQAIGDCTKIGQVGDAVRQGYFAAWAIQ